MSPDIWIVRCKFRDFYDPPSLIFDDVLTLSGPHAEALADSRFSSECRRMRHRDKHALSHPNDVVTLEHNGVVVKTVGPRMGCDIEAPIDVDPPRRRAINEPPTDSEVVALLQTVSQMGADDRHEVLRRLAEQGPMSFTRGDR
jgi:hypothetical protein